MEALFIIKLGENFRAIGFDIVLSKAVSCLFGANIFGKLPNESTLQNYSALGEANMALNQNQQRLFFGVLPMGGEN